MLVQVPALDQFGAQGRVDRDATRGLELERPEQVARCNEREVMLNLRRPYVRRLELAAFHAAEHACSNVRLPSFELSSRRDRPQQPLPVDHPFVEVLLRPSAAAHTRIVTVLSSRSCPRPRRADRGALSYRCLGHGRAIEVGNHSELLAASGAYAELYRKQEAAYR